MDNEEFAGVWVIAMTESSHAFIGKVGTAKELTVDVRNQILSDNAKGRLALNRVCELFSPLRPVQVPPSREHPQGGVGVGRDPIPTGLLFCYKPCPLYLGTSASLIFFADMDADDRRNYETYVRGVDAKSVELRASRANILVPKPNGNESARVPGGGVIDLSKP